MDTQLKKGVLELCILHQLSLKDMYGYELMKTVKSAFPDVYDASIYAILRRIHAEGHTDVYYGRTSGGPQRKYYRLTSQGYEHFQKMMSEWQEILLAVHRLGIST
jgi:PadR family transcriptional regulator PadR